MLTKEKYKSCPICSGHVITKETSLGRRHPEIAKLIDKKKNRDIDIYKLPCSTIKKLYWTCRKDKSHSYSRRVVSMVKNPICLFCENYKIDPSKSLKKIFPDLVKFWNYKKNKYILNIEKKSITPNNVLLGSHSKIYFTCPSCKKAHNTRELRFVLELHKIHKLKSIYCLKCFKPGRVAVKCNQDGKEFLTITDAGKYYNITDQMIHFNITGKSKYASAKLGLSFSKI
jgi:hypothetical protein